MSRTFRKHVRQIATQNWQGRSFKTELAPLTAIVGENMEGKSTIPSAMRVGLIGYSPEHGKTNNANWGFVGADKGAAQGGVALDFSDATSNAMRFEMKKGKVEVTEKKLSLHIPPVMLDLHEEFFKLSGPKRTDFVFARMDMSKEGFAVEEITARLKKDVKVKEPSAETEAKLGEIVDEIEELDRNREDLRWSYQTFIEKCVAKIDERAKAAATTVEQMAGTQQGTTVLRGADAPLAPFDPEDLRKAREDHQAKLQAKKDAERITTKGQKLRTALDNYKAALDAAPNHAPAIEQKEKAIADLQSKIEKFQSQTAFRQEERQAVAQQHTELETTINLKTEEIAKLTARHKADTKKKCCPRCKSKGKGWEKALAEDWDEIEKLEAEVRKLTEDKSTVAQKLALIDARIAEAQEADEAQLQRGRDINRLRNEIKSLEEAMNNLTVKTEWNTVEKFSRDAISTSYFQAVESLKELEAPGTFDDAAIEKARQEVERLENLERSHSTKAADDLRIEEAKQKKAAAEAEKEVASLALTVFKKLKAEMIEKAFTGFMGKVNRFTKGLFRNGTGELLFRDGEIGYMRGATWVSLDHFSGTEKMLTYIGLSIALAEESPLRIVFVDEWLRDDRMRHEVAARLAELQKADAIDQAIIIDTRADGYEGLGFKTVTL